MTIPLYVKAGEYKNKKDCPNKGLLFERFFDNYKFDYSIEPESKKNWLEEIMEIEASTDAFENFYNRQVALVESLGGVHDKFKNSWHFVTGMGLPHPVENGLAWHPTLGIPYLQASGVKGMVRAWMEEWLGTGNEKIGRLFGTGEQAGNLIFFDAVPCECPKLVVDVMTPHMGKWYEKGGSGSMKPEDVPADWHDPVPVQFMALKKVTLFFAIAPVKKEFEDDAKEVFQALEEALENMGAGAKTASGYGRFDNKIIPEKDADNNYLKPGNTVACILLEEKTKKGGWRAKLDGFLNEGPIFNTADVPDDKVAGDKVSLIVKSSGGGLQLEWETDAVKERIEKSKTKPKERLRKRQQMIYFISRHKGAKDWFAGKGYAVDTVLDHLDLEIISKGDVVIGSLPVNLVAAIIKKGARYFHLSIKLPMEARGVELSPEDMDRYGAVIEEYHVNEIIREHEE